VLDAQGVRDTSPTAQRLLSVLSGKMLCHSFARKKTTVLAVVFFEQLIKAMNVLGKHFDSPHGAHAFERHLCTFLLQGYVPKWCIFMLLLRRLDLSDNSLCISHKDLSS
jgi:hypothetical protein